MKAVYKFPYSIKSKKFTLLLGEGWKFIAATVHNDKPHLWVEYVDGAIKKEYTFEVFGTAQEIPLSAKHMTTYEIGPFVFHLYLL